MPESGSHRREGSGRLPGGSSRRGVGGSGRLGDGSDEGSSRMQQYMRHYRTADTLFVEHEEADELFVLRSGRLSVRKGGHEIAVIEKKGAFVGELSLLLGMPRSATVVTLMESDLIVIPGEALDKAMEKDPAMAINLARLLAQRLVDTSKRLGTMNVTLDKLKETCDGLFTKHRKELSAARDWTDVSETRKRMLSALNKLQNAVREASQRAGIPLDV